MSNEVLQIALPESFFEAVCAQVKKEMAEEYSNKFDLIWSFEDLRDHLQNKSAWWVRQEVLDRYQKQLDVKNGGFVIYPTAKRVPWRIDAERMADFIRNNWTSFNWNASKKAGY